MHSVKYNSVYPFLEEEMEGLHSIKDKIHLDIERGNILINKAILHHNFLEKEGKESSRLAKRYNRLKNFAVVVEVTLTSLEVGLSAVATLSTPLVPVFGVFALGAIATKVFENWMLRKLKKHSDNALLASSKVKSLEEHFIKSMEDGTLSNDEYLIIKKEVEMYLKHKNKISESNNDVISAEEQELLTHFRKLLCKRDNNTKNLTNSVNTTPSAPPQPNN
jgi:hypothetical protein